MVSRRTAELVYLPCRYADRWQAGTFQLVPCRTECLCRV